MTIKPVADLYSISVPGGRSTSYSTDAAEASDCKAMGWAVQEYVKLDRYQAAMLQGADGNLINEDTKRVGELVMWVKRLAHSLRKASPDSKLQSDAMDYLSRKGLISVEDVLR